MTIDIRAGKRVLYKHKGQWEVGRICRQDPRLTEKGLYIYIIPEEFLFMEDDEVPFIHDAEINDLFLEAHPVEEWTKSDEGHFLTKEAYINFVESDDFKYYRHAEMAYVSDGEYYYYPISQYNRSWIEKQPFDYVVRID